MNMISKLLKATAGLALLVAITNCAPQEFQNRSVAAKQELPRVQQDEEPAIQAQAQTPVPTPVPIPPQPTPPATTPPPPQPTPAGCWTSNQLLCWVGACGGNFGTCFGGICVDPSGPDDIRAGRYCCSGRYYTNHTGPDGSYTDTGYNRCL